MVTRESMKQWIIECLHERNGSAWPKEASKYVWDNGRSASLNTSSIKSGSQPKALRDEIALGKGLLMIRIPLEDNTALDFGGYHSRYPRDYIVQPSRPFHGWPLSGRQ